MPLRELNENKVALAKVSERGKLEEEEEER